MENKEDSIVKKLRSRRFYLRDKIRSLKNKNQNARDYVIEYLDILEQLKSFGIKAENHTDYLQLEYWDKQPTSNKHAIQKTPKEQTTNQKPIKNTSEEKYTLCLAWTEVSGAELPVQIAYVKEYFNDLCLKCISDDVNEIKKGYAEHILKYEYKGTEDAFRMLKLCVQFVLDTFAKSDFDKFNIAIYGRKNKSE